MIINKKGMAVGQVFIFIVAAITFALVMIFGYKAIIGFISQGEEVQFFQLKDDLESSFKKIYPDYGAIRINKFDTPLGFTQICFVDLDASFDPNLELCNKDSIACDAWKTAQEEAAADRERSAYQLADENVFFTPPAPAKIKVYKFRVVSQVSEPGYLCLPIRNGQFELMMEGKGNHVEISLP